MQRLIGLGIAFTAVASAASSAHAGSLPTEIGACTETKIKEVTTRLGTPDSGTVVQYANGLIQISYETIAPATRSKPGDKANVCLVSVPKNCPPGDNRGKIYKATNLRTNESWEAPDSQHSCGGA
jgi:hypothetical protein